MKQLIHKLSAGLSVLPMLLIPGKIFAATSTGLVEAQAGLGRVGEKLGGADPGGTRLPLLIGSIINTALGLMGIIFVIMVVYAGVLYMTDPGDGKKIEIAKKLLKNSIIGIVLIVAAYAISSFVIAQITSAVTNA